MAHEQRKKNLLKKHNLAGVNKPKRTPNHKTKSHMVLAQEGHKLKLIRFGQQGVKTAGKPKAGESAKQKARRKSFKARHGKNIAKGKMSAAFWANKTKW
jgi:tRNA(Ile2) C34 agmatinyltransferase TiaS